MANPVQEYLRRWVDSHQHGWPGLEGARTVLAHGREYIGIQRPKGYRHQRAPKMCFRNAAKLAFRGRGTYVEGFAMSGTGFAFDHAWITIDGEHAIDPTLPVAPKCHYFGIPFSKEVLARALSAQPYYGVLALLYEQPRIAMTILDLAENEHPVPGGPGDP